VTRKSVEQWSGVLGVQHCARQHQSHPAARRQELQQMGAEVGPSVAASVQLHSEPLRPSAPPSDLVLREAMMSNVRGVAEDCFERLAQQRGLEREEIFAMQLVGLFIWDAFTHPFGPICVDLNPG